MPASAPLLSPSDAEAVLLAVEVAVVVLGTELIVLGMLDTVGVELMEEAVVMEVVLDELLG